MANEKAGSCPPGSNPPCPPDQDEYKPGTPPASVGKQIQDYAIEHGYAVDHPGLVSTIDHALWVAARGAAHGVVEAAKIPYRVLSWPFRHWYDNAYYYYRVPVPPPGPVGRLPYPYDGPHAMGGRHPHRPHVVRPYHPWYPGMELPGYYGEHPMGAWSWHRWPWNAPDPVMPPPSMPPSIDPSEPYLPGQPPTQPQGSSWWPIHFHWPITFGY